MNDEPGHLTVELLERLNMVTKFGRQRAVCGGAMGQANGWPLNRPL